MTKKELIRMLKKLGACETWLVRLESDYRTPQEIWEFPISPDNKVYPKNWVINGPSGRHYFTFEESYIRRPTDIPWELAKEFIETDYLLTLACPEYLDDTKWFTW